MTSCGRSENENVSLACNTNNKSFADVTNLTGGNKAFEELKNNGADYIVENFSYSILEIFDMRTKREDIIQRESYWKRVFQTIKYGMNNN